MTAPNTPTPELEPTAHEKLEQLLGEYWDFAYTEGDEGRSHDTYHGDAQLVRSDIFALFKSQAAAIEKLTAERDMATKWWDINLKRAESAEKRVKELEASLPVWHSYIREALGLREDEPMRFDYYATKIDNLMSAYVDGYDSAKAEYKEYLQAEYDTNKLLSERVAVLETALEPFAKAAGQRQIMCDDTERVTWSDITVGDLRRALAAREAK